MVTIGSPPGEGWGERTVRALGMDMYMLPCLKWITSKVLLFHRELCSTLQGLQDGRGVWWRKYTGLCHAELFCCVLETITTLLVAIYNIKEVFLKGVLLGSVM